MMYNRYYIDQINNLEVSASLMTWNVGSRIIQGRLHNFVLGVS
jgi:hypothetical protein